MNDQLQAENRNALVGVAAVITFPYLWLSLFAFLAWLYHIGFFGRDWGSIIVLGLLGIVFLIPAVPMALTKFIVKPLFSNLLGREIITMPGCITGLVSVVGASFVAIYFLSRGGFGTAGLLLLAMPVVGLLLAGGVSLLARGGGVHLGTQGRKAAPRSIRVEKPAPPALSPPNRPSLPPTQERPLARQPEPRRSGSSAPTPSSVRRPPPPRRK